MPRMKGQPKTKGYCAKAARASRARRRALAKAAGFNDCNATTWRVK